MKPGKGPITKDLRTRILLVDDHAIVRYGIAQLINREADLTICGEEEDAGRALSAIERLKPDLVIATSAGAISSALPP
jgi:DNA-binding NarL/FixJ family response regulator